MTGGDVHVLALPPAESTGSLTVRQETLKQAMDGTEAV
jgi:hypothetical protein